MPIKNFEIYVAYDDRSKSNYIDYVKRKARTREEAQRNAEQEFSDAWVQATPVHEARRKAKRLREEEPVFPTTRYRPGGYIFRHKGKKKRGRRNYPERGYRYPRKIFHTATWTETRPAPVRAFLNDWLKHAVSQGGIHDVRTAA